MPNELADVFERITTMEHPADYAKSGFGGWPWLWCARLEGERDHASYGSRSVLNSAPASVPDLPPAVPPLSVSLGLGRIPTVGAPIYYLIEPAGGGGLVELQWTISGGSGTIRTTLSVLSGPDATGVVHHSSGRQGHCTYKFTARGGYVFQVTATDSRGSGSASFEITL